MATCCCCCCSQAVSPSAVLVDVLPGESFVHHAAITGRAEAATILYIRAAQFHSLGFHLSQITQIAPVWNTPFTPLAANTRTPMETCARPLRLALAAAAPCGPAGCRQTSRFTCWDHEALPTLLCAHLRHLAPCASAHTVHHMLSLPPLRKGKQQEWVEEVDWAVGCGLARCYGDTETPYFLGGRLPSLERSLPPAARTTRLVATCCTRRLLCFLSHRPTYAKPRHCLCMTNVSSSPPWPW